MRRVGLSDSAIVKRGGRGDGDVPEGTSPLVVDLGLDTPEGFRP